VRPARSRYSVTTRDPGASEVLTHGRAISPASTARLARSPAAIITDGFEVFVQEVIAAITTEPSRMVIPSASISASDRSSPPGR
jgi:hypothetical protein